MVLSWIVQGTLWGATTWFFKRLGRFRRDEIITLCGIGAFFFFNPNQLQNFTWAFQMAFFSAFLFSTLALICITLLGDRETATESSRTPWLILAMVAAFVSECNLAGGVLTWVIMPVCAALLGLKRRLVLLLCAFAVAGVGIYLIGYRTPGNFSDPLQSVRNPGQVMLFVGTYLGESWQLVAPGLGLIATIAALVGLAYLLVNHLRTGQRHEPLQAFAVSVALMMIATAVLTALGRQNEGLAQAQAGRYQTPAMLFWWAILLLTFTGITSRKDAKTSVHRPLIILQLGVLVAFAAEAARFPALLASNIDDAYLRNGAGLAFEAGLYDLTQLRSIYPLPAAVPPTYSYILEKGLMAPPFKEFADVGSAVPSHFSLLPNGSCIGSTDVIRPITSRDGKQDLLITGWGYDLADRQRFRRVLATTPAGIITGIGVSGGLRPDVERVVRQVSTPNTGWQLYALSIPSGEAVQVYGIVPGTHKVCLLPGGKTAVAEPKSTFASALPPLNSIPETGGGSFDLLNGQPIPTANDPQHPFHVSRVANIAVQGWMISADGTSAMDQVYAVYPGGRSTAKTEPRPDVAAHFNQQKLLSSGFRFDLPPGSLGLGLQTVDAVGVTGGQFYRFARTLYLFVQ
jgi:drug/metabolite transporter (DMT)-like permease